MDATSALCEFSRMRWEGQLYNTHEAFVNEVAMYAELRRARPRWYNGKVLVVRLNNAVFSYIRSSYVSSIIDVARTVFTKAKFV